MAAQAPGEAGRCGDRQEVAIDRSVLPPPHVVCAPHPARGERDLPFEEDPGPGASRCRRCGREDGRLEAELVVARESLEMLGDLMVWLRDEVETSNLSRQSVEEEAAGLRALLGEFETLASSHDAALRSAAAAVAKGRRARLRERARADAEEARASRLAAELKRVKDARTAGRPADASPGDVLALALAAAGAAEGEERVLELESALRAERVRSARFARYVEALEARLRALAESEMSEPAGVVGGAD